MGVRCSKNPVSLQSKHGLAYNLDESGAGCLCKVFVSKRKVRRGEKDAAAKEERENEVTVFWSSKISMLLFVVLGNVWGQ